MIESHPPARLTVGISTRNRFETLARCVRSIALISDSVDEIVIIDDASDSPVEIPLRQLLGEHFPVKIRVLRHDKNTGPAIARNLICKTATSEFVLNLDDDAFVLDTGGVQRAAEVMMQDDRVAVIAFAQANADGMLWADYIQPAPVKYPCWVPTFTGYGYMVRRETYLSLGGFRDEYFYMGEEKELCLRLLDAGHKVVYLPESRVGHMAVSAERDQGRFVGLTVRNGCWTSFYDEPFLMMFATVPFRLLGYFRMNRGLKSRDVYGFRWVLKELYESFPRVWRERRPVKWSTIRQWRRLRKDWPRYQVP